MVIHRELEMPSANLAIWPVGTRTYNSSSMDARSYARACLATSEALTCRGGEKEVLAAAIGWSDPNRSQRERIATMPTVVQGSFQIMV